MHDQLRVGGSCRRLLAVLMLTGAMLMLVGGAAAPASAAGPPCPSGSTYNKESRMCEAPPVPQCAAGSTLDANGVCTSTPTQTCPSGQLQGGLCVGSSPTVLCNQGGSYDVSSDRCRRFEGCTFTGGCSYYTYTPTYVCASGFTYNTFRRQCVRPTTPTCAPGATLNTSTGACEAAPTPTCATGFTLNTASNPVVCQAPPLRGASAEEHGTGKACPPESPNDTGTPPNCGNGRGGGA